MVHEAVEEDLCVADEVEPVVHQEEEVDSHRVVVEVAEDSRGEEAVVDSHLEDEEDLAVGSRADEVRRLAVGVVSCLCRYTALWICVAIMDRPTDFYQDCQQNRLGNGSKFSDLCLLIVLSWASLLKRYVLDIFF